MKKKRNNNNKNKRKKILENGSKNIIIKLKYSELIYVGYAVDMAWCML